MDGPLDFEDEDPLLISPVVTTRSKKVIDLDDLLSDYYNEKSKVIERESKRAKAQKTYDSDEDDNGKEVLLSKKIDGCHDQMKEMGIEDDFSTWGLELFGIQKTPPPLSFGEIESCTFLQPFLSNEDNSLVELHAEEGETFLEGLLVNGWVLQLVLTTGQVDRSIARWTFNLMLYSAKEELVTAACDFWCAILLAQKKVEGLSRRIEWLPSYFDLKTAIETYGYQFNCSLPSVSADLNSHHRGPPNNIRCWLKFTAACCQNRDEKVILSALEAEELVEVVICLSLDCQLQGLLVLLRDSMQSIIDYFTGKEWDSSCEKISRSIACRVPIDFNCLRSVEFISGVSTRSTCLRSRVSYHMLLVCFDNKAINEEEVLSLLISINVKDKNCDLFKMYIYLVLTENWLLYDQTLKSNRVIYDMWGVFLRHCSCQIASTDLRPYASKVRTKASYLLHGTTKNEHYLAWLHTH